MKPIFTGALLSLTLGAASLQAVDYSSFDNAPGIIITGVRSTSTTTDDVVLTASYNDGTKTYAALYSGSLAAAPGASIGAWTTFLPDFDGQAVSNATLYGPNTSTYTSSIGTGNVIAVGSYKYGLSGQPGADLDHGLIYQGSVNGGGTYTQIDATALGGSSLRNTIAHSNMGSLVVGNYDTGGAGRAFIYNMSGTGDSAWTNLNPTGTGTQPVSITAYGIWQNFDANGDPTSIYTIAGGVSEVNNAGLDSGYLVNFDAADGTYSDYTIFQYDNQPLSSLISHFDGITATEDGFNLTGDYVTTDGGTGAFFANVKVNQNGSFGPMTWTDISISDTLGTSGNTVVGNNVLGIYVTADGSTSYLATVPEPSTYALLALGAGAVLLGARARSRTARA